MDCLLINMSYTQEDEKHQGHEESRVASVPAEMRNENHLNTSLQRCHYTSLLHELLFNGHKKH